MISKYMDKGYLTPSYNYTQEVANLASFANFLIKVDLELIQKVKSYY
jgi:hypothetical protein